MEEPLLFISTPPFYYIEVEENGQEAYLDESTSIYELSRSEKLNPVIERQLHFFSQPPRKNHRYLAFHLKSNEKIIGLIEEYDGNEVKVRSNQVVETIHVNQINSISTIHKTV